MAPSKVRGRSGGSPAETPVTAETFASFAEPGVAELAESTLVIPDGLGGCILTLESRVAMTDSDADAAQAAQRTVATPTTT